MTCRGKTDKALWKRALAHPLVVAVVTAILAIPGTCYFASAPQAFPWDTQVHCEQVGDQMAAVLAERCPGGSGALYAAPFRCRHTFKRTRKVAPRTAIFVAANMDRDDITLCGCRVGRAADVYEGLGRTSECYVQLSTQSESMIEVFWRSAAIFESVDSHEPPYVSWVTWGESHP